MTSGNPKKDQDIKGKSKTDSVGHVGHEEFKLVARRYHNAIGLFRRSRKGANNNGRYVTQER